MALVFRLHLGTRANSFPGGDTHRHHDSLTPPLLKVSPLCCWCSAPLVSFSGGSLSHSFYLYVCSPRGTASKAFPVQRDPCCSSERPSHSGRTGSLAH